MTTPPLLLNKPITAKLFHFRFWILDYGTKNPATTFGDLILICKILHRTTARTLSRQDAKAQSKKILFLRTWRPLRSIDFAQDMLCASHCSSDSDNRKSAI
jgi:hypothetical protein